MRGWVRAGVPLYAPALWSYEAVSTLRRLIVHGKLGAENAEAIASRLHSLGVREVATSRELQLAALDWAEKLGHSAACDAAYLAVAADLGAPLWTADRRLANRVRDLGLDWVHAIQDEA